MAITGKHFPTVFRLRAKLIAIHRGCTPLHIIVHVSLWLCKIKICPVFLNLPHLSVCRFSLAPRDYDLEKWHAKFSKPGKQSCTVDKLD